MNCGSCAAEVTLLRLRSDGKSDDRQAAKRGAAPGSAQTRRQARLRPRSRPEIDRDHSVVGSGRRLHRPDAGRAPERQRGGDPRQRPRADDRLSHHRGGRRLDRARRRPRDPGHALAIDQETGFGLVQALGRARLPGAPSSAGRAMSRLGDRVAIVAGGGTNPSTPRLSANRNSPATGNISSRRRSSPRLRIPSGAARARSTHAGKLLGIGSLHVRTADRRRADRATST